MWYLCQVVVNRYFYVYQVIKKFDSIKEAKDALESWNGDEDDWREYCVMSEDNLIDRDVMDGYSEVRWGRFPR